MIQTLRYGFPNQQRFKKRPEDTRRLPRRVFPISLCFRAYIVTEKSYSQLTMLPPVSVCHHVSTMGQRPSPTTSKYHLKDKEKFRKTSGIETQPAMLRRQALRTAEVPPLALNTLRFMGFGRVYLHDTQGTAFLAATELHVEKLSDAHGQGRTKKKL